VRNPGYCGQPVKKKQRRATSLSAHPWRKPSNARTGAIFGGLMVKNTEEKVQRRVIQEALLNSAEGNHTSFRHKRM